MITPRRLLAQSWYFFLFAAISLPGCATQELHVTAMTYAPEAMDLIGPVGGTITKQYFLCVPWASEDDSLEALTKALRPDFNKPGIADAILNPAIQTTHFFLFPFYCSEQVTVTGIGIKFKLRQPGIPLPGENKTP